MREQRKRAEIDRVQREIEREQREGICARACICLNVCVSTGGRVWSVCEIQKITFEYDIE